MRPLSPLWLTLCPVFSRYVCGCTVQQLSQTDRSRSILKRRSPARYVPHVTILTHLTFSFFFSSHPTSCFPCFFQHSFSVVPVLLPRLSFPCSFFFSCLPFFPWCLDCSFFFSVSLSICSHLSCLFLLLSFLVFPLVYLT